MGKYMMHCCEVSVQILLTLALVRWDRGPVSEDTWSPPSTAPRSDIIKTCTAMSICWIYCAISFTPQWIGKGWHIQVSEVLGA